MSHLEVLDTESRVCFNGSMTSTTPTDKGYHTLDITTTPWMGREGHTLVTNGYWNYSTTSLCKVFSSPSIIEGDDGMVTMSVFHYDHTNPTAPTSEKHPLHGSKHATKADADRVAYEAGILAYFISDTEPNPITAGRS